MAMCTTLAASGCTMNYLQRVTGVYRCYLRSNAEQIVLQLRATDGRTYVSKHSTELMQSQSQLQRLISRNRLRVASSGRQMAPRTQATLYRYTASIGFVTLSSLNIVINIVGSLYSGHPWIPLMCVSGPRVTRRKGDYCHFYNIVSILLFITESRRLLGYR